MSLPLTIDGKICEFKDGDTVLDAAKTAGISIPTLCHHPKTGMQGTCRVCVVEVDGPRGSTMQASCALPARAGMVVRTKTEAILKARRTVVELMLVNGQHNCISCERNGACELQDVAYELGIEKAPYIMPDVIEPVDDSSEMIVLDRRKCIKCGRCVAACNHVVVNEVLGIGKRGSSAHIVCDDDLTMAESSCVQCGECSQICPTGAIIDKKSRGLGRRFDLTQVDTTCTYCGVGCQISLHVDKVTNKIVKVTGRDSAPNYGMLCVKGRYGFDFHASPKRLTQPLIKKDGKQVPVSWDEALDYTAKRLTEILAKHGPDAFSALGSGRITNENNYAVAKFTRAVMKTNNVDHCARTCHAPTVAGLAYAFGSGAATNSVAEIVDTNVMFVIGSNMTEAHPIVSYYVKQAHQRGAKLIVSDPRQVDITRWADEYVQFKVGTDVPYLNGLIREIIENGWHDQDFMDSCTENPNDIKEWVKPYTLEYSSSLCGVPVETLKKIARILGEAKNVSVLYTLGVTEHICGTDNVKTIANLQMVLGHIGKRGGGVNPLRGQNNVQGACDMGALPNVFHNYQSVEDPKVVEKMAKDWGVTGLSAKQGYKLPTMLHKAIEGVTKAMLIVGDNTVQTEPHMAKTVKEIKALEFLAVSDIFPNITTVYADVVFPDCCFAEDDGNYSNLERRVSLLRKAVDAPGQAKPTWWIMQEIAKRMGVDLRFTSAEGVWEDHRRTATSMAGITYQRIQKVGLQWPCPTVEHPGTPILHLGGKFTRGKGLFSHTDYRPPAEQADKDYPFVLSTGRRLWHYHTATQTRNSAGLENLFPEELLEISEQDGARMGIKTGDIVKAISRRGEITLKAWVTKRSPPGVCWTSFHFHEACANVITNSAYDNVTETPEYKACAINVVKVADGVAPVQKVDRQARP